MDICGTWCEAIDSRRQLGLNEEDLIIGWMARMAEVKNPFLLLEVARKMPEVNFIMAGGGQLLAEIEKQAPTNVDVIGWTDASHFWAAVDCAVSTSDNEGIPIALIEAQLAGVPVVATDAGSTREVISDGYTGFVTGKNSDDLVQALYKIILDSKLRSTFSTNAMTFASRNFQPEKMLESHAKIYSELIGE